MTNFTRRTVLTATAAGAAFGLAGPVEILSPAAAQGAPASPLNPKSLKFHRFKVGDIEVTQVFDGAVQRDHDQAFIPAVPVDQIKGALKTAGLPDDKLINSFTITIVRMGDRQIMFDSGNGLGGGNPAVGHLAESAKAAGIDLAKTSTIIVTHFHPDHIYGLVTKENAQVYGGIEISVPEPEYKFWADAGNLSKLSVQRQGIAKRVQATMPTWKNLKQHAVGKDVVPGVRAIATPGHTPGHTSYLLSSGGRQLIVLGDVTNIPAFNLRNPGWHLSVDQDAPLAEQTRRRIFDQAVADKAVMTGYHWGMPGAGTLAKDGGGYVLAPVA